MKLCHLIAVGVPILMILPVFITMISVIQQLCRLQTVKSLQVQQNASIVWNIEPPFAHYAIVHQVQLVVAILMTGMLSCEYIFKCNW